MFVSQHGQIEFADRCADANEIYTELYTINCLLRAKLNCSARHEVEKPHMQRDDSLTDNPIAPRRHRDTRRLGLKLPVNFVSMCQGNASGRLSQLHIEDFYR